MRFYTRPRRHLVVNIVSLIDILCIVLIFFIVTTTFRKEEPLIKLELPESHHAKPGEQAPPTIITVSKSGTIFVGANQVSTETLVVELKRLKAEDSGAKFAMKASKEAPYGAIVKVMDAALDAGCDTLNSFVDETPAASPSAPASPSP